MADQMCGKCAEGGVTTKGKFKGVKTETHQLSSAQNGAPLTKSALVATYSCPVDGHPDWEGPPPSPAAG